jgi:predicted short-subunit dehydrogenase-like oxidoreductase (DUF2520 family)
MTVADLGARMLIRAGLSRSISQQVILSAIPSTLAQYARLGEKAWTGPLARDDQETLSKHLAALERLPPYFSEVYDVIGRAALAVFRRYGKGKHLAELLRTRTLKADPI